jgi:S1-C subfamily serine protease
MSERSCVNDAKRLGFFELPALQLGATLDFRSQPVTVHDVTPGTAAQAAGLQVGDAVIQLDQQPVRKARDVVLVMGQKKPGDKITITIERGNSQRTLTATIPAS